MIMFKTLKRRFKFLKEWFINKKDSIIGKRNRYKDEEKDMWKTENDNKKITTLLDTVEKLARINNIISDDMFNSRARTTVDNILRKMGYGG